jgi:formiminotetrahydrofolate cyclodeaminase
MAWPALQRLCEELEAPLPSPAGGSAAAAAAAIAASLVVMVGRGSPAWPEGAGVAERAALLRDRLVVLGAEDAAALAALVAAARAPVEAGAGLDAVRARATEAPREIAALAAEVGELAARAHAGGKAAMRSEARAAEVLAAAGARIASAVVAANLAVAAPAQESAGGKDPRSSYRQARRELERLWEEQGEGRPPL